MRALLVLSCLFAVLVACADDDDGAGSGDAGTTVAGGVTLTVPDGWGEVETEAADGVLSSQRWAPDDATLESLQVVVGCDDEAEVDDLVQQAITTPRGPMVATDHGDVTAPEVPGLDDSRQVTITLGGGRDDDASTLRVGALYGQTGDALVLLELTMPVPRFDRSLVDRVVASVEVDGDALADRCAAPAAR